MPSIKQIHCIDIRRKLKTNKEENNWTHKNECPCTEVVPVFIGACQNILTKFNKKKKLFKYIVL